MITIALQILVLLVVYGLINWGIGAIRASTGLPDWVVIVARVMLGLLAIGALLRITGVVAHAAQVQAVSGAVNQLQKHVP